jgi:hypothetical protein
MRALLGILSGLCLAMALLVSMFLLLFWGWWNAPASILVQAFSIPLYFLCFFLSAALRPSSRTLRRTGICGHALLVMNAYVLDSAPVVMVEKLLWFIAMILVVAAWWLYLWRLSAPVRASK